MRQAQSHRPRPACRTSRPAHAAGTWSAASYPRQRGARYPLLAGLGMLFSAVWWILTLPFRLVFGALSLAGRMVGVTIGFTLMVVGAALGASPFYLLGIPVFIVGLLLTLRNLG